MKQDLQVAIIFTKLMENNTLELFAPLRVAVGALFPDGLKFYDVLSNHTYSNLDTFSDADNYKGFYYPVTLNNFCKNDSYDNLFQNLTDYLKEMKKNAYFYNLETGLAEDFCLKSLPVEEFNKKYKLSIKYQSAVDDITKIDFDELLRLNEEWEQKQLESKDKINDEVNIELPPISEIYEKIKKNVLCQDNQIKKILTAIYKNLIFDDSKLKSNIFIYGPTGVGKTAILNQISNLLNLPMVIEDSTAYTEAGYKGKDCEEMLRHLYMNANGDIDAAEHGILVIDEIDKKNNKGGNDQGVSTEAVLNSLLKIIEGGKFEVEIDRNSGEKIEFDTSHLTVIVSGAFEKMINPPKQTSPIGFNTINTVNNVVLNDNTTIVNKLVNYGLPKEFIGRFNTFVKLNSLSKDNLKTILLNSESSALKLYIKNLEELGIKLNMEDGLIDRICDLAYIRNTGARALNNIVSELLDDKLFDTFSSDEIKEITIDNDALSEKKLVKTIVK